MTADAISIKAITNTRSRPHLCELGLFCFRLTRGISVLISSPRHLSLHETELFFDVFTQFAEDIPCRFTTSMFRGTPTKIVRIGHSFAGILRSGEFEEPTVMQQPTTRVNVA